MRAESIDYNGLTQANLARVFGEHDASRRMTAMPTTRRCTNRMPRRRVTPPLVGRWKHYCRACRQTSSSVRSAPPSATTASDGCAGNPVHRRVPWP
jgi:hypothetical protein